MSLILFTRISGNRKTGPIPVSTSPKNTCPDCCPLKTKGCYAKSGVINMHWLRVSNGSAGITWPKFLKQIRLLPHNQLWRHNQAGDLPGVNGKINSIQFKNLVRANTGRSGFTYTHKPVLNNQGKEAKENRKLIKFANQNGFTVNLSANSLAHADSLKELAIGPVVTLLPSKVENKTVFTPAGNKVVVCPATYRNDVTCAICGLCAVANRSVIIGFPSHGNGIKTVDALQKT